MRLVGKCIPIADELDIDIGITDILAECLDYKHEAVLLSTTGIQIEWIENENSDSEQTVKENIEELLKAFRISSPLISKSRIGGINFRLIKSIPINMLENILLS